MMTKGKYWIGDLGCIMTDEEWRFFLKDLKCEEGEHKLPDGRPFAVYRTAEGDGTFQDDNGNDYSVDTGTLGCIKVQHISPNMLEHMDCGNVLEFAADFRTRSLVREHGEEGKICFGKIEIKTDPSCEEDEYEEEEEEYDDEEDE